MNGDLAERTVRMALAGTLCSYPDDAFSARLAALKERWSEVSAEPLPDAQAAFTGVPLEDLASAYLSVFELAKGANPLHETSFGQGQGPARGNVLADIAAFYEAFGLSSGGSTLELPDHLAVQLEFYTLLLLKQVALESCNNMEGQEVVRAAQMAFLRDHLGPLVLAASGVESVLADPVYGEVLGWVRECVLGECACLGVQVTAAQRFTMEPEPDTVACMAPARLPVLP